MGVGCQRFVPSGKLLEFVNVRGHYLVKWLLKSLRAFRFGSRGSICFSQCFLVVLVEGRASYALLGGA